ncbi:MAG: hypothetical protein F6K48_10130 [Okeania sp. SIO3H1]|uniref:DUF6625 family protein n=1 Tax=Okeania sp. SIO1I7 TaxID=2607772 RepID=UPI0013CB34E5|nr:DUF6625 family protein [Okeania sp. SIO1I7]NEN89238.1 hypothetical protein [Okeania sp. SIO3H1]NET29667.1 hypothetical protein [Okeania sp. SIO1I7]
MKIILIIIYFGEWPVWFPAFLQSCKYNPDVDWLFFTDCPIPETQINNVNFIPFTIKEFNELASHKLDFPISLSAPYKVCDFRPCYGLVFEEYLANYDFWGHCDLDIIWGQIRTFITDNILLNYDIISARKHNLCGHFTLYRNTSFTNTLFREKPNYQAMLQSEQSFAFDETQMKPVVQRLEQQKRLKVYWPKFLLNFAHQISEAPSFLGEFKDRWYWERGKLYERGERNNRQDEIMYLHFMTWKKTLNKCSFDESNPSEAFYISYFQISNTQFTMEPIWVRLNYFLNYFLKKFIKVALSKKTIIRKIIPRKGIRKL